jgi:hypothetical protein
LCYRGDFLCILIGRVREKQPDFEEETQHKMN